MPSGHHGGRPERLSDEAEPAVNLAESADVGATAGGCLLIVGYEGTADKMAACRDAAAGQAILTADGTITHHHGIGTDHRQCYSCEIGAVGVAVLRGVKAVLDPQGICNPGHLAPVARVRTVLLHQPQDHELRLPYQGGRVLEGDGHDPPACGVSRGWR